LPKPVPVETRDVVLNAWQLDWRLQVQAFDWRGLELMRTYVCVYLGAAILALVLTPMVMVLARRINALDHPGVRSVHARPIPRIGGVAIFLSAMCMIVSVLLLDNQIGMMFRSFPLQMVTLLCAVTGVFLVGLIDDLRNLPARVKFAAELIAAVALCWTGVRITTLSITSNAVLHLAWLSYPLTVLWIVGITNAVNLSDGLDGLAAGVSAIACAVIAIFAIRSDIDIMAIFMLALLGGLTGFLFFNFNPAKIFMGDCGSLFVGFTIASASVMCLTKCSALVGLALPMLAMGIPIFDTLFSMLRRFLERRSLFAPDRSHFHHRLMNLGLKQCHAVIAIYAATCVVAGLGLFMLVRDDAGALVLLGGLLLLQILMFRIVGAIRFRATLAGLYDRCALALSQKREQRTFEDLQLRFRQTRDDREWWDAVCEAARRLDFDRVSLSMTDARGPTDVEVWRKTDVTPKAVRVVTMNMPLSGTGADSRSRMDIEVAIIVDGSVEAAGRRGVLFGRLIDERCPVVGLTTWRLEEATKRRAIQWKKLRLEELRPSSPVSSA
jgi:UDP-GlcNAc:undecaprenyl-phosphate/decaprenyl-phosphate GlcNAc-1-phosphate transferase